MKRLSHYLALLAALLLPAAPLAAQDGKIPAGVITSATTTLDGTNQPWGYLLLTSPQAKTLRGRKFGVHLKPAAATAAGEFSFQGAISPVTTPAAATALIDRAVRLGENRAEIEKSLRFLYRMAKHPNYLESIKQPPAGQPWPPGTPPRPDDPLQPGEPPVGQQAVLVMTRATEDTAYAGLIEASAQVSPAMALLCGRGWAGPLPATGQMATLEVRLREAQDTDGPVVGRVELRAGQPVQLPAPGAPVQVPHQIRHTEGGVDYILPNKENPGHLAINLRWATPEPLRRLSAISQGYKVYRIDAAYATQSNLHTTPPTAEMLEGLLALEPNKVIRLSNAMFLPPKVFLESNVADFSATAVGDPFTTFVVDRNERCCGQVSPGPLADGEQFYYFVVACDLLGQPGLVSRGGLARACRTVSPLPPQNVRVEVDSSTFAANGAVLPKVRVTWDHDPNVSRQTFPTHYEVLRGVGKGAPGSSAAAQINDGGLLEQSDPLKLVACNPAPIVAPAAPAGPPAPPATEHPLAQMTWVDETPFLNPGETCWYAVRAVYRGACSTTTSTTWLYSEPTGIAYATLLKFDSPAAPTLCHQDASFPYVIVAQDGGVTQVGPAYPKDEIRAEVRCQRENNDVTHVKFELWSRSGAVLPVLTRLWETTVYFPDPKSTEPNAQTNLASAEMILPAPASLPNPTLRCIAYGATGAVSTTLSVNMSTHFPAAAGVSVTKATRPRVVFRAGAFSLNSPPPVGSALRSAVAGASPVTATVTAASSPATQGRGLTVIPFNNASFPADTPVVVERQVNGVWEPVGGARVSANNALTLAGELAGSLRVTKLNATPPPPNDCSGLVHQRDNANGSTAAISLGLCIPANIAEYRVYRQIDDEPLQLIEQGPSAHAVNGTLSLADPALPAVASRVQYFSQLVDGDGNASPMTALLACPMKIVALLPTPSLNQVRSSVSATGALEKEMKIEWSCPAPGIERFQIFVETEQGAFARNVYPIPRGILDLAVVPHLNFAGRMAARADGATTGTLDEGTEGSHSAQSLIELSTAANVQHLLSSTRVVNTAALRRFYNTRSLYTGRVGPSNPTDANDPFIGEGPVFSANVPISGAGKYKVWIKAVGPTGGVSAPSNVMEFSWSAPKAPSTPVPEPAVPWPARDLPASRPASDFDVPPVVKKIPEGNLVDGPGGNNLYTFMPATSGGMYPRGVVIGRTPKPTAKDVEFSTSPRRLAIPGFDQFSGRNNPNEFLAKVKGQPNDRILPAVLYRRQIPNAIFPSPSGDVIQVSPLITNIASYRTTNDAKVIIDTFTAATGTFDIFNHNDPTNINALQHIEFAILDLQPVIEGASYQYYLVRFDDKGEIKDVINCGATSIEETP